MILQGAFPWWQFTLVSLVILIPILVCVASERGRTIVVLTFGCLLLLIGAPIALCAEFYSKVLKKRCHKTQDSRGLEEMHLENKRANCSSSEEWSPERSPQNFEWQTVLRDSNSRNQRVQTSLLIPNQNSSKCALYISSVRGTFGSSLDVAEASAPLVEDVFAVSETEFGDPADGFVESFMETEPENPSSLLRI